MERQLKDLLRNMTGDVGTAGTLQGYVDGFTAKLADIKRQYEAANPDDPDIGIVAQDL